MTEPRHDLIAHIRDQIKTDPEAYANQAKLKAASGPLTKDIATIKARYEQTEKSENQEAQDPTNHNPQEEKDEGQ